VTGDDDRDWIGANSASNRPRGIRTTYGASDRSIGRRRCEPNAPKGFPHGRKKKSGQKENGELKTKKKKMLLLRLVACHWKTHSTQSTAKSRKEPYLLELLATFSLLLDQKAFFSISTNQIIHHVVLGFCRLYFGIL